jgi:hypothetical protein
MMRAFGPPLNSIDGRKSGPLDGFNYSPANKSSGITWSEEIFPNRSRSAWQLQRLVYGLLKPFSIRHKIISAVLYWIGPEWCTSRSAFLPN